MKAHPAILYTTPQRAEGIFDAYPACTTSIPIATITTKETKTSAPFLRFLPTSSHPTIHPLLVLVIRQVERPRVRVVIAQIHVRVILHLGQLGDVVDADCVASVD